MRPKTYKHVESLPAEFRRRRAAIRHRLDQFRSVPKGEYFYELAYCVLTPQSSAVNAAKAIDALRTADFFGNGDNPSSLLHQKDYYIRFHNTKTKHLIEARAHYGKIFAQLTNGSGSRELREWLVRNVRGLGWKEASHFLRNIGHCDLAILDRHILKNLQHHGVLRSVPRSLTQKQYLAIEKAFALFATHVGITMDELDLLFWSRETGEILK